MDQDNVPSDTVAPTLRPSGAVPFPVSDPLRIDRYRIIRLLGIGSFGRVYLAHDDELDRNVAVKVPNRERISSPQDLEAYFREAKVVAKLEHPNIVPVYDVGRTDDGLSFVVSKFIPGTDLATTLQERRPGFHESVKLVASVAEALHYAHSQGLVHRDVKPANILIDTRGEPFVTDFGLALKEEDFGRGAGLAGTPLYMSPEQARGEGHRVDGRSDVFGLGAVFYELLTGKRPFRANTMNEVLDQIANSDVRPPRQYDETIPREVERICLKALAKRATDRFSTAWDMAEDLTEFLRTAGATVSPAAPAVLIAAEPSPVRQSDSDQRPIRIVPKGLRSFDEHDADFFLELLPGPRDRDGLPDSIRFWKRKIEQLDADKTFRVGLIYGPSGCGKSSLVKAGLLPRLNKHVLQVYAEAAADDTEARLLKGIRKVCPQLPPGLSLVESLAQLRRGPVLPPERKVLLIIDQFEQWLHAKRGQENTELVAALRHCDGGHVQGLVLVRADFWLAACRFMQGLEIRLLEGENSALVDLFDPRHAKKVLAAFGRAYGTLSENVGDLSKDQEAFLDQAIPGVVQDGKIISVRLALFAEMMKGKAWTPATLTEVGGTAGVGLTFLEETFSASTAPPEHRFHERAAQAVLKALLPETGGDIKGRMKSHQELLDASGYSDRRRDFDDLIRILDPELRLITPTDPERFSGDGKPTTASGQYYQLTHDYLVHSLRDWLTRKQRETPRGRAELRLAERSRTWNARPENRHLPSIVEWATIRSLTRKKDWTGPQRRMMRRAGRVNGRRAVIGAALLLFMYTSFAEIRGRLNASKLIQQLELAEMALVPNIVEQLPQFRRWTDPRLRSEVKKNTRLDQRTRLRYSLALLPVDPGQVDYLYQRLLVAQPDELPVLRKALVPQRFTLSPKLWSVLGMGKAGDDRLLPAAGALALFDSASPHWGEEGGKVAPALVSVNSVHLGRWLDALRVVRCKLTPSLSTVFRDGRRSESERMQAANILADYASDDLDLLVDLLLDSEEKPYSLLFEKLKADSERAVPLLESKSSRAKEAYLGAEDGEKDRLARRLARAAVALVRLGACEKMWEVLRHGSDPGVRGYVINWLKPLGAEPKPLKTRLDDLGHGPDLIPEDWKSRMDAILFNPVTSERRALILALGEYGVEDLAPGDREPLLGKLLEIYRSDPDAGVHGAAEWALRRWKQEEAVKKTVGELRMISDN
ncbi:MAG: serine/threonine-protein kinase [Isosphaeraceae bacterium]